ncbi:MAG: hypothetical protein A3I61_08745 [Acidobacteria bacterium RIFCSPLOWO2_02_FULL_68_18]|nr:MAG: hypothetical protein A3I61_08745 [Acidobacteria bacterium RIFCSPLOWO2_02_FULL_68_18]OFW49802.1 MAG: hypothetical protein A3G77_01240 [Acidobacteria bacterium RIFCSPLOWO2_12_FULL_68_19]
MKRILVTVVSVLALATSAAAQQGRGAPPPPPPLEPGASQADVDLAVLAAPPNLAAQATVVKWKSDFTYDTLRKGTNRLVCYDRSGQPNQQPFAAECTSIANLERVAQNMRFEAAGDKRQAMLDAAEKDGTRVKPEYGSIFYNFGGPDRERARGHMTVAVPGATTQSTGLPDNNKMGGAWIMNAGTSTAHIMVPGH